MKLTFLGAAHEVTGSLTLFEACGKKMLIDCGMEQGTDIFVNEDLPINPSEIDCVLLTHAHTDHAGKLPWLVKNGFSGKIYCTHATADLCAILLADSAHIQQADAEWYNRKATRSGKDLIEPLYTVEDAMQTLKHLTPIEYGKMFNVFNENEALQARFIDAGHLLGSASIEAWATENNVTKKIVFSGDIGNVNQAIIRDPSYIDSADYVVMESTYGNRSHISSPDFINDLTKILQSTFDKGGNVVIPAFAVGRTQELLYFLRQIIEYKTVHGHDDFLVYVDSPLANEATNVFRQNVWQCCDDDTRALLDKGINPLTFSRLRCSITADESKAINAITDVPSVIISASGMCDAGRIRHHLKHNLWRSECTVLFVGYQAEGTLGRMLLDGAKTVRLFGETIDVKANIINFHGVSGHADDNGLIKWASSFKEKPTRVFVNHGSDEVADIFAKRLQTELGYTSSAPYSGDSWDLVADKQIEFGSQKRIEKKQPQGAKPKPAWERLLAALKRLTTLVNASSGRSNKDLAYLEQAIKALCDKWE